MSVIEISTPDGKTLELNAPDGATPEQIHQAAMAAANHYKSQMGEQMGAAAPQPAPSPQAGIDSSVPNPSELLNQAAPSNLLKLAGVASVNAPGMVGAAVNSIPGIGQLSQLPMLAANIQKNPQQGKKALMRMAEVNAGAPVTAEERIPATAGKVAGNVLEMMAPTEKLSGIKATGPFTAGLKMPSTALPGSLEKAGAELGAAKVAARAGEDAGVAKQMRMMLQTPKGTLKLAEDGKAQLEGKKDIPMTKLLAYKEALGKMQAEGGTFANDYAQASQLASQMIKEKAPELAAKLEQMATNFKALGDKKSFPWFTTAVNPKVGLAKLVTLPGIRNAAGAASNPVVKALPNVLSAIRILTEDTARRYLKKARGNKDAARQMATAEGWKIPE
jgi:hypothetical protein